MRRATGFTLLELIVTVAILAIVLSVGVPGFRAVVMDNRLVNHANEFVTSVNMARSAAVRFQRNATICTSANYSASVPTCGSGSDWSQGWIVWVDKDRDAETDADEIIAVHEPLTGSVSLTSGAASRFSYDARGFGTTAADDMMLCDDRTAETGRLIKVNSVGRTNVSRQDCS